MRVFGIHFWKITYFGGLGIDLMILRRQDFWK